MNIKSLIAKSIILYGLALIQNGKPCCSSRDSDFFAVHRTHVCHFGTLGICCNAVLKIPFSQSKENWDLSQTCMQMILPLDYDCNSQSTITSTAIEWGTTTCCALCCLCACLSQLPCLKEKLCKKIRDRCCYCLDDDNPFCPQPPVYLLNDDGSPR